MTPEAINRAIAELRGWTRTWDPAFRQWVQRSPDGLEVICDPDPGSGWETNKLPNYYGSRDACAEFESTITDEEDQKEYAGLLHHFTTKKWQISIQSAFPTVTATAPQRCEAFLRLHNRWEEA